MQNVNLHSLYSKLQEAITRLFDSLGVRRSFTVPYVEGQPTSEHITSVGAAAKDSGGLSMNLLTSSHKSGGKGWGSGDGATVGHPAEMLKQTIIPEKYPEAIAAIDAAQSFLNSIKKLIPDDPAVSVAQSQLDLLKPTDGAGMNLMDFGIFLIQLGVKSMQAIARAHQGTKPEGHSPKLSLPRGGQAAPAEDEDEDQPDDQGAVPAAQPQQ